HSPELDATVAGQFAETFAQQYPGIWQGLDQAGRDQLLAAAKAQQAPLDTTHRLDQWMDAQKAASPEILGSSADVHSTEDLDSGEETEVRVEFDPQSFQQAATELTQQLALAGAHTELRELSQSGQQGDQLLATLDQLADAQELPPAVAAPASQLGSMLSTAHPPPGVLELPDLARTLGWKLAAYHATGQLDPLLGKLTRGLPSEAAAALTDAAKAAVEQAEQAGQVWRRLRADYGFEDGAILDPERLAALARLAAAELPAALESELPDLWAGLSPQARAGLV